MFYRPFKANILRLLMIVGALAALSVLSLPVYNLAFAQQEVLRFDYDENGMEPVAVFTADDPEGDEVSWMLAGDDEGDFNIDNGVLTFKSPPDFEMPMGGSGSEANTYSVDVIATDGTIQDEKMVSVTVMDVDEPGMISLLTLQPQAGVTLTTSAIVDEDGAATQGSEEWQWSSSSSMNGTYTDIDDAEMMMYRPKTGDTGRYLKATVTYTDPEGPEKMVMAVSANPVKAAGVIGDNNAPEFPDQDSGMPGDQTETAARSIPENTAPGMSVGAPVAADDDDNDVLTYSLSGTAGALFDIDPATGQILVAAGAMLDYDANAGERTRNLTVTVRDPFYDHDPDVETNAQSQDTIPVVVTITNVDEAPEFDATMGGATSLTFAENTNIPVDDGDNIYNAADPEGATVTYSLAGDDASELEIDTNNGTTLTFMSMVGPDYENPSDADRNNRYEVTVEASDAGGMLGTRDVTVMVTNVMEAGMITLSTLQPTVGVALMTEVTDLDGDVTGPKYQWYMAQGAADQPCSTILTVEDNEIDKATQASYTPKDDDEVMCLAVVVNYTDGQGSDTATAIAANPVVPDATPRAPVFGDEDSDTEGVQNSMAERSVAENTVVGTDDDVGDPVMATDPNGGIVTHTLSGTYAGSFTIDRGTGQINVAAGAKLDRETKDTYTVVVTATDPSNMISSIVVTIKIDNVPEGPKVVGDARFDYDENGMEPVAVFTADDPEGDEVSWMLAGDDEGDFNIDNGVLTFKSPPDFEMPMGGSGSEANTYSVDVIATDGTIQDEKMVSVTVMDVDEPGMISLLTLQPQAGVTLTTSAIVDEDGAATQGSEEWQWSSSSSMNGTYTDIDDAEMMMYRPKTGDTGRYLKATVTYTDPEGPEKMVMAVSANPVKAAGVIGDNNAPEFPDQDSGMPGDQTETAARSIPENTAPGMSVGAPVAADDDDNDVLTYSLSGTAGALFDIDPATGQILVAAGAMLDYDANAGERTRNLTVTVRDPFYDHDPDVETNAQSQDTIPVVVTITNVDEAPEFDATMGGATSLTFAENTNIPVDDGDNIYNAADPEGATVTYSLAGDDASELEIDTNNGTTLTFMSMVGPDYENPSDADRNNRYEVTVEASDATVGCSARGT